MEAAAEYIWVFGFPHIEINPEMVSWFGSILKNANDRRLNCGIQKMI